MIQPNAERDLSFAVLALQTGQVTPEPLLAGLHAWLAGPAQSIGTILLDQRALTSDGRDRLDELVAGILEQRGRAERTRSERSRLRRFMDLCRALEYAAMSRPVAEHSVTAGAQSELGRAVALARENSETAATSCWVDSRSFLCPDPVEGNAAPCAQVYALGIVLYGLLTGKAPFDEADEFSGTLERMRRGDFWPPRALQPAVPAALEAVCLKALQPRPVDRYRSVEALADDIDRWLAGEPVTACAETMTQRLLRWSRHHRTIGAATVGAVVVVAAALAIALALTVRDRQQLVQENQSLLADAKEQAAALQTEQVRRRLSVTRWLRARDQLAEQMRRVLRSSSANLTPQQIEFVDGLLAYYRRCTQPNGVDDDSQAGIADAWYQLGVLEQRLGRVKDARSAFLNSETRLNPLVRANPSDVVLRQEQANGHLHLGALQADQDPAAAEREYRLGVKLHADLTKEYPLEARLVPPLVSSERQLAAFLVKRGKLRDAAQTLQEALAVQERTGMSLNRQPDQARELSKLHFDIGTVQTAQGDQTAARQHFDRAVALQRALADKRPNGAEDQYILANMLTDLARAANARKDLELATRYVDEAVTRAAAAVKAASNDLHCWMSLSNALSDKAIILTESGRYTEAADLAERLLKQPVHSAAEQYNAACAFARCAALAGKDGKLSPSQRQQMSRDYADCAMKALAAAVAAGFRDRAYLTRDPDLEVLHSRDDFRKLITALPAKAKAKNPQRPNR